MKLALFGVAVLVGTVGCTTPPPPSERAAPARLDAGPVVAAAPAPLAPAPADATPADLARLATGATVRIEGSSCEGSWTGSGFLLDLDGDAATPPVVVTNRHVVAGSADLDVFTADGRELAVTSAVQTTIADLGVVSVAGPTPEPLRVAGRPPRPGDPVTVVGYPGGGPLERNDGTVVDFVLDVRLGGGRTLRLDAWVRPGNSGGPVLDGAGEVAGVVYAVETATDYGLAVPAAVMAGLLEDPRTARPISPCEA